MALAPIKMQSNELEQMNYVNKPGPFFPRDSKMYRMLWADLKQDWFNDVKSHEMSKSIQKSFFGCVSVKYKVSVRCSWP